MQSFRPEIYLPQHDQRPEPVPAGRQEHSEEQGPSARTPVPHPSLDEVVRRVTAELKELTCEHNEIMKRIGNLRRTLSGLATIFGNGAIEMTPDTTGGKKYSWQGFTNICRLILMSAETPLSSQQVCALVKQRSEIGTRHRDPLASVTTVLNRLAKYGEVTYEIGQTGSRLWRWNY